MTNAPIFELKIYTNAIFLLQKWLPAAFFSLHYHVIYNILFPKFHKCCMEIVVSFFLSSFSFQTQVVEPSSTSKTNRYLLEIKMLHVLIWTYVNLVVTISFPIEFFRKYISKNIYIANKLRVRCLTYTYGGFPFSFFCRKLWRATSFFCLLSFRVKRSRKLFNLNNKKVARAIKKAEWKSAFKEVCKCGMYFSRY